MLSPVSSIELSHEAKFFWLLLLPSIVIVFFLSTQAISTWDKLDEHGSDLELQRLKCEKDSSSYALFLQDYRLFYSSVEDKDHKYQLFMKIIEYENLKYQNKLEAEYLQLKISDYRKGSEKSIRRVLILGLLAFLIGYVSLILLYILLKTQYVNTKVYSECQSCARIIDSTIMNFGTERNGTFSRCFCNQCYKDGEFSAPSITLADIEERARKEMEAKGISAIIIEGKVNRIKTLKRWKIFSKY